MGTINIFKASLDNNVKRVVFVSSSAVYGENSKKSIKESDVPNPMSPYGLQKLTGEQFAKLFFKLYNIPIVSLRLFNVYGPGTDFDSDYGLVIGRFLYARRNKEHLTIFGDGKQTRQFCYIDDVAEAMIKAAESEKIKGDEIINISSEKAYSVNYLAELISDNIEYLPARTGYPMQINGDISLAKKALDWNPNIDL